MSHQNNSAWPRLLRLGYVAVCAMSLLALSIPASRATVLENEMDDPQSPSGHYGQCGSPSTSAVNRKSDEVFQIGNDPKAHLDQITAIKILDCHGDDGPGVVKFVTCPADWPVTPTTGYCVQNMNDGLGNDILLGVRLDPNYPCYKANVRPGPPVQIDVVVRSPLVGIDGIIASSAINARWQPYSPKGAYGPLIVTFTKINQSIAANTGPINVFFGEGLPPTTCSFTF